MSQPSTPLAATVYRRTVIWSLYLAFCVVVMGAWVRLTDAGLGCPDWPGCYGQLLVPDTAEEQALAVAAHPERPLEAGKAWREMLHRYAAGTLGLLVLGLSVSAWANRKDPAQPVVLPTVLLVLIVFQALLGMWTVTLLLKPVIVMGHLLGGMATLACLFWLWLKNRSPAAGPARAAVWPQLALLALILQIALGGWTSTNYAALACPDFPTCQTQWWPENMDFREGFVMWRGLGVDYEGGVLDNSARTAIHMMHRLGALFIGLFIAAVALFNIRGTAPVPMRAAGRLVLAALIAQIAIGISVVHWSLPLTLATAHNAVAALLLLSVINLNYRSRYARSA